jgi:hypothetical protein
MTSITYIIWYRTLRIQYAKNITAYTERIDDLERRATMWQDSYYTMCHKYNAFECLYDDLRDGIIPSNVVEDFDSEDSILIEWLK